MAGSNYLANITDGFELPSTLPVGLGAQASAILDAYLKRPEGLIYNVDANLMPCSMAAAAPSRVFAVQGALSPGTAVVATLKPAMITPDMIGKVLVLDNASGTLREACVVTATNGNNQVTLGTVQFAHADKAPAMTGLTISEDRSLPSKRSITRVCNWPIVNVLSILGRYAYGRRSDQVGGLYQEMNLLAAVQTFGGPPQWIPVPVAACSWSDSTGEIWVPAGLLMAYYSDARIEYIAGYTAQTLPDAIVRATVAIANTLNSGFDTANKMMRAGDTAIERFAATAMSDDLKQQIEPFKARTFF